MTPPPTGSLRALSNTQRWSAFGVACFVAALTIMDLSKVNVALPSIQASFNSSSTVLKLVVSGYILAFGLALVPFGRLGDLRSRKVLFVLGLSVFTAASVLCAVAPNDTVLMIARLLQGIGAGIQMPQVIGLTQQLFQGAERAKAFGVFGAVIGIATAVGPTVGGLFVAIGGEADGWRLVFWLNLPLGIAALVLAALLIPGAPPTVRKKLSLDPFGLVLFAVTVSALMFPFLFTTGSPDDNPARWWVLLVFGLFGGLFVWWERRAERAGNTTPLVPMSLFSRTEYRNGTALQMAYFTAFPPMFLLTTLFLQEGVGLKPVFAGMVSIGFALVGAYSAWWGARLVATKGKLVVVIGVSMMLASAIALGFVAYFVPADAVAWVMAGVMVVGGFGGGLVITPNQTLTLETIPVSLGGLAGSVQQLGQRVGTAIGSAVTLALFYSTVFRESGTEAELVVYQHAYARGMGFVAAALALALLIGCLDLWRRAHRKASGQAAGTRD